MRLGIGVALSCLALSFTAPAVATTYFAQITNGTGAFDRADIDAGLFSDQIKFDVPMDGMESVNISFFEDGLTALAVVFNGQPITLTKQWDNSDYGAITAGVPAGPQTLVVSGRSDGTGAYAGNVLFGAVPEPATWVLMLFGFGAIGVAARRDRSAQPSGYPIS